MLLWHPLLTGDGGWEPEPSWRVLGANGEPAPAYQNMVEFSFLCPNKASMREASWEHLQSVLRRGDFDGVFLDRMRFPSPAVDPVGAMGCFCDDCKEKAEELHDFQEQLLHASTSELSEAVFGANAGTWSRLFQLRCEWIAEWIAQVSQELRALRLEVGLDCFSPLLTRMVGQDLQLLEDSADWIKIMSYGHVYAPAGIPGELLAWCSGSSSLLHTIAEASGVALPETIQQLETAGLSSDALLQEARTARMLLKAPVYAGIELVALEGITRLSEQQIVSDVEAFRKSGVNGLSLSWDLWHIPLRHLEWVAMSW